MAGSRIAGAMRSTLAVIAGIVTLTAISFGIEAIANAAGIGSGRLARLLMYGYGALSIAAGGAVTAWLSGRAPLLHAFVMGIVQTALTVWAAIAMTSHTPISTWIITIVTTLPATILGGWLYVRMLRRKPRGAGSVTV